MKTIVIVFSNDNGNYYIEQVCESMEKASKEWGFDKVIDGRQGDAWRTLQSELQVPTVPDNGLLGVIEEVL